MTLTYTTHTSTCVCGAPVTATPGGVSVECDCGRVHRASDIRAQGSPQVYTLVPDPVQAPSLMYYSADSAPRRWSYRGVPILVYDTPPLDKGRRP